MGAGWRRGPNARSRAPPPRTGPPRASSAGTRPQPGPGSFGRPGASPHASEERTSGWAGGRAAPSGAHSPAPGLRRPHPRPGPGGFRRPGASPRASEERASGRAGGRAAHAGWPPRALARQPPACAVLAWPDRVPASFWFTRSERRHLHASSRGAPLGTVRLRTATRTKACDPSATASALPLGRPPPRKDTSRLRGGHRSPHAPGPSRCDGAPAPGYGRPTAGRRRAWLRRRAELAPWPPPEALPPCALHYFSGEVTCPIFHLPSLFSGAPLVPGSGGPPTPAAGALSTSAGQIGAPAGAGLRRSPEPTRMARRRPQPARAGQSRSRATAVPRPPRPARSCAPSISAGDGTPGRRRAEDTLQTGG